MQQEPTHPGELFQAEIKYCQLTVAYLADRLPVHESGIYSRLSGESPLFPAFLQRLATVIPDLDIQKLADTQRRYTIWQQCKALQDDLATMADTLTEAELNYLSDS